MGDVRYFNEQSAATPETILAAAAKLNPKRVVVIMIDENDRQQTMTSVMSGEQLAWLNMCFNSQMADMVKPR